MSESILPKRNGFRPRTTPTNPHTQLEQNPEREVVDETSPKGLRPPWCGGAPERHLCARSSRFWLREELPTGPQEAFMIGREFVVSIHARRAASTLHSHRKSLKRP